MAKTKTEIAPPEPIVEPTPAPVPEIVVEAAPPRKYYEAQNSNRALQSNGLVFKFSPYAHTGGTWFGTYTTDDKVQIAALDKLASAPTSGVFEISETDYQNCVKKKEHTLQGLGQSLIHLEQSNLSNRYANHAAPLDTEPLPPPPEAPPVEGIDALSLGITKMPE
jgi:hypothetical protein